MKRGKKTSLTYKEISALQLAASTMLKNLTVILGQPECYRILADLVSANEKLRILGTQKHIKKLSQSLTLSELADLYETHSEMFHELALRRCKDAEEAKAYYEKRRLRVSG